MRALAVEDVPVLFSDGRPYDPHWCDHRDPLVLDAPRLRSAAVEAWATALGEETAPGAGTGFDLAPVVAPYRLGGDRIVRAARAARDLAAFDGGPLTPAHLRLAARQQSASGLEQHARRVRPDVGWDDLVLPDGPLGQLRELALRARHRDRVLGEWRLSAGGGRGRGVLGLFAGDSGTGKTLSAEVVAAELGLDLYVVQLSSVVDKYVGETEKNLERIFTEADRTDAVLLFDEADSVFGKRSEVKDAHDRYANMESSYLLQRLESFEGIALLTTNLRANIDEAFTRRLDLVVDFPFPDADQRLALWWHALTHVPRADGIDPRAVARDFELAGVRSAAPSSPRPTRQRAVTRRSPRRICWRARGASTARRGGWCRARGAGDSRATDRGPAHRARPRSPGPRRDVTVPGRFLMDQPGTDASGGGRVPSHGELDGFEPERLVQGAAEDVRGRLVALQAEPGPVVDVGVLADGPLTHVDAEGQHVRVVGLGGSEIQVDAVGHARPGVQPLLDVDELVAVHALGAGHGEVEDLIGRFCPTVPASAPSQTGFCQPSPVS